MRDSFTGEDLEKALRTIDSMALKAESAKQKFAQGTAHHTLQEHRLNGLTKASALISKELKESNNSNYSREELEKAFAPLTSLLSKSEKARAKLHPGSWQHTAMSHNIEALSLASLLLMRELNQMNTRK
jgi:hypothetical protein